MKPGASQRSGVATLHWLGGIVRAYGFRSRPSARRAPARLRTNLKQLPAGHLPGIGEKPCSWLSRAYHPLLLPGTRSLDKPLTTIGLRLGKDRGGLLAPRRGWLLGSPIGRQASETVLVSCRVSVLVVGSKVFSSAERVRDWPSWDDR